LIVVAYASDKIHQTHSGDNKKTVGSPAARPGLELTQAQAGGIYETFYESIKY